MFTASRERMTLNLRKVCRPARHNFAELDMMGAQFNAHGERQKKAGHRLAQGSDDYSLSEVWGVHFTCPSLIKPPHLNLDSTSLYAATLCESVLI